MIDGMKCEVNRDNPFLNRKWYGKYVFDPELTMPENRAEDFVACVKNMFQCVTLAYDLTLEQQKEFMGLLHEDLRIGLYEITQQLKEREGL